MPSNPVIGRVRGVERGGGVYTKNTQRGLTLFSLSLISSIRQRALGKDRLHPISSVRSLMLEWSSEQTESSVPASEIKLRTNAPRVTLEGYGINFRVV